MATVEPLSLASLPQVSARAARATRPWVWADASDRVLTFALAGVGTVSLSWLGWLGVDGASPASSAESFFLVDREGRAGRIAIDRWLALGLVAATLGLSAPLALRRLGAVERGVLGGHLATLIARWKDAIVIDLGEQSRRDVGAKLTAIGLRAEAAAGSGMVRLDVPPEWLCLGRSSAVAAEKELGATAGRLRTVASLELAATTLRKAELAAACPGDAVVFDGRGWSGEPEPHSFEVRIGDYAAPARMIARGDVALTGPFQQAERRASFDDRPRTRQPVVQKSGAMTDDAENAAGTDVLAAAPIEIVAEVGRIVLRGDEVLGLEKGSILSFGRAGRAVDLVIGGRPWARGELVSVDGELGVRITELVRG